MTPNFRGSSALRNHVQHTMDFYHPRCIDPSGGFYHYFKDDGTVYDHHARHLVSSTRFIFNYAMAFRHFGRPEYLEGVRHGLKFLRDAHRNPVTGAYAWQIRWENGEAANTCWRSAPDTKPAPSSRRSPHQRKARVAAPRSALRPARRPLTGAVSPHPGRPSARGHRRAARRPGRSSGGNTTGPTGPSIGTTTRTTRATSSGPGVTSRGT